MTIRYTGRDLEVINNVSCTCCGARKQMPCTYVQKYTPGYGKPDPRVGFPTKQPHMERRETYRKKELREQWDRIKAERSAEEEARLLALHGHYEALHALRTFDQIEYTRLRSWLQMNVGIFLEKG